MSFNSEWELVRSFAKSVGSKRTTLPKMSLCFEFLFTGGKTDVIGVTGKGTVHSFEAKLKRWRKCLDQAYRNTSFCHFSYVVLPVGAVQKALQEEESFQKRGVGLCSVEGGRLRLHIRPKKQQPLQPWLTQRAVTAAREGNP